MADPNVPVTVDTLQNEIDTGITKDTPNDDVEGGSTTYDLKEVKNTEDEETAPPPNAAEGYPVPVGDIFCWRKTTNVKDFFWLTWKWLVVNRPQLLSGITVALAQVPEAVSFSFVAGVDPIVGLQSAWIMGLITSLFGGRPGMVAGSTGAIAIVLNKCAQYLLEGRFKPALERSSSHFSYLLILLRIPAVLFSTSTTSYISAPRQSTSRRRSSRHHRWLERPRTRPAQTAML